MKLDFDTLKTIVFKGVCGSILFFVSCSPMRKYTPTDREWALPEIAAFETLDQQENYPKDAILFLGSSSIRLWKTIKEDMAPYSVIQRGYGGAHFRDLVFFTERILADHSLQMVVCFVANDIKGTEDDATPNRVFRLFKVFVKQVREQYPEIPIMQIAITPTQSRWEFWDKINRVNKRIKAYCDNNLNLYYIDTVPTYLDEQGQPKPEWFVKDQLHLNETGYAVWSKIIKSEIEKVIPLP